MTSTIAQTPKARPLPQAVNLFDALPNSAVIDISSCVTVLSWSRSSINRAFKSGLLTRVKVGHSTRIRVGEVRHLMGVPA